MNEDTRMKQFWKVAVGLIIISSELNAYESILEKTSVGTVKIIKIPERLALEAQSDTTYFEADNGLFRKLFSFISDNGISMTTPVEAEIKPGKMRFFVGEKDKIKPIRSNSVVEVKKMSPMLVVAIGVRGSYSEDRFRKNEKELISWIKKNEKYEATGDAYAVYWNGPFVPGFLKRSEIHIPIRKRKTPNKNNYQINKTE
ncbi:MAG: hypothetical protein HN996_08350 [Opitutae bacterium]|nr:hypothetical protein [Opitutae bacterium]